MELDYQELYDGFLYLDELRDGGSVNMYGATSLLAQHLDIDKYKAKDIWKLWIETFDEDMELEERIDMALEDITYDDD